MSLVSYSLSFALTWEFYLRLFLMRAGVSRSKYFFFFFFFCIFLDKICDGAELFFYFFFFTILLSLFLYHSFLVDSSGLVHSLINHIFFLCLFFLFEPTSFARSPVEVGCVVVGMCVQKRGAKTEKDPDHWDGVCHLFLFSSISIFPFALACFCIDVMF